MPSTIYQFKPWSRLKGDAQKVGEAIEGIIASDGAASPHALVKHARDADSVLHPYFLWDDTEAAEKYREQQAGHLLRSLVAVRCDAIHITAPVRGFVPVAREEAPEQDAEDWAPARYVTIAEATRVVSYRDQLLRDALRDLDAYRIKYQLLADLTGWSAALTKAKQMLERAMKASQREDKASESIEP